MSFSWKNITKSSRNIGNILSNNYFKRNYGSVTCLNPSLLYNFNEYSNWNSNNNYSYFNYFKYGLLSSIGLLSGVYLNNKLSNKKSLVCGGAAKLGEGEVRLAKPIEPNSFEARNHFYEKVLNAEIHPMVNSFLNLSTKRLVERYCHLHPKTDPKALTKLLNYRPKYLKWAGADLFVVTNERGQRLLCVIETNTCPSGQKSMPHRNDLEEQGGYKILIGSTFKQLFTEIHPTLYEGALAVIYDKNDVESIGYACAMADLTQETVYAAEFYNTDPDPPVKFENGVCYVRVEKQDASRGTLLEVVSSSGISSEEKQETNQQETDNKPKKLEYEWIPVRAAFRYVTQKPWDRIPINTKTKILNPIITCLAGGRNKNIASKAYQAMNTELLTTPGLQALSIVTPQTIHDVPRDGIPFCIKTFGGVGVVKVPYSNAGQGVWTITNDQELEEFMNDPFSEVYDKFIVQSLIGNVSWSSVTSKGKLYHVGTIPNKVNHTFAADIRMMINYNQSTGWSPLCVYSRRARFPLVKSLANSKHTSWDILGTNLSVKLGPNLWQSDTHRLLLMDKKDFNKLGIGIDDLIDGFVQTVMATIAIDKMAVKLMNEHGNLRTDIFEALNDDKVLIDEILHHEVTD